MTTSKLGRLLDGIRRRDSRTLKKVYQENYPLVQTYILNNNGSDDDAKDIFQEALMVVYNQLRNNTLKIEGEFGAYIMGVSKRLWLMHLRNRNTHGKYLTQLDDDFSVKHPSDEELLDEMQLALIRKYIAQLGDKCQKILKWSAAGLNNEAIAKKMGVPESAIRSQKTRCREKLREMIKEDPDYRA